MGSGFYAAFTGLAARTEALDLLASNLANSSTTGYKAQLPFYQSFEASRRAAGLGSLNRAVNDYGVLGGASINLQAGSIESTGNDLDVALEGSGFLVVQTKAGLRYTRNGNLKVGPNGDLESPSGDPVLGQQGPINLPSGQIAISADGTISHNGTVVDQLRLVDFPPGTQMALEGSSYYSAPAGTERPATNLQIRQGSLEASNLNPIAGTVGLIELQRQTETLQNALQIFHNVFNLSAAQDLPRVT